MVASSYQKLPTRRLLLEVASDAKVLVSLSEQFCVHSAVCVVADRAALADGFVFEDKGAVLRDVTFAAGLTLAGEGKGSAEYGVAFVNVMAVTTPHLALQHGMVGCQVKLAALVEVAGEARFRILLGVHDGLSCAAALGVDAARAVTGLASNLRAVWSGGMEPCMRGGFEITGDIFVALGAVFRTHECRSRDLRWHNHHACQRGAGDEACCEQRDNDDPDDSHRGRVAPEFSNSRCHKVVQVRIIATKEESNDAFISDDSQHA